MDKEKYSLILYYITEYIKRKKEPIRNIENSKDEYSQIIWLSKLPKNEAIEGITDSGINLNGEFLLKITKPKEPRPPAFPKLSEVLEQWVAKDSLTDENGSPRLRQSIVVNGKTLLATHYPQIEKEFSDYVKNKWLDDFVAYKTQYTKYENRVLDFEILNKTYEVFFSIYTQLQKHEEDYELIACIGLMYFKKDDNASLICRHILTSKTDIIFEQLEKDDFIEVVYDVESFIQIETDAITDLSEEFEPNKIIDAEKNVYEFLKENNNTNNLYDKSIKDALSIFAKSIHNEANFVDQMDKPEGISSKPLIYLAPALILRKKNTGGFTTLCEKIIKIADSIKETISLPASDEQTDSSQSTMYNAYISDKASADTMKEEITSPIHNVADTDNQIKIDSNPKLLSLPEFLVFTSMQNVYKVQNKVFSTKMQILGSIAFEAGEKPIYLTGTKNYSGYLIVAYENGKIGKINMESFKTDFNRKKLKNAYNNESRLVFIELIEEDTDLVAISNINKILVFNTRQINPVGSKTTKGFQVMKSKDRSIMTKVKKLNQVNFQDIEYYRRNEGLNAVGFYLKQGDEI